MSNFCGMGTYEGWPTTKRSRTEPSTLLTCRLYRPMVPAYESETTTRPLSPFGLRVYCSGRVREAQPASSAQAAMQGSQGVRFMGFIDCIFFASCCAIELMWEVGFLIKMSSNESTGVNRMVFSPNSRTITKMHQYSSALVVNKEDEERDHRDLEGALPDLGSWVLLAQHSRSP